MQFCADCREPCDVVHTVVDVRGVLDSQRGPYSVDVYGDASACCDAEVLDHDPSPCCGCDAHGVVQCPACHYWYCWECFEPVRQRPDWDRYRTSRLPPGLLPELRVYVERHANVLCHSTRQLLENNLTGAVGAVDATTFAALKDICRFLYNELPAPCWGSPERVEAWLAPLCRECARAEKP